MISKEDSERIIEAQSCKDCLGWHKHCKAECCKIVFLNINPEILKAAGTFLNIRVDDIDHDLIRYYRLRDVEYTRGRLRLKKDRILVVGRKVMYVHPCKMLTDDLKCKIHNENKPEICKALDENTPINTESGPRVTDNCLFKYK